MKFKITRAHFLNGLSKVSNVVSSRAAMPILANVLLEAEGNVISLTTTNLDFGIRAKIKAEVTTNGSITLPVQLLNKIISSLSGAEVSVELNGQNRVKITSGSSVFNLEGIESQQFPALPVFTDQHKFVLEQSAISNLLSKVYFAHSEDKNRYVLNGIYFSFADEKLTLVATDGRRLAIAEKVTPVTEEQVGSIILPAKSAQEMQPLLGNSGNVQIAFDDKHISFTIEVPENDEKGLVENIYLISKVIEGNYPNFKQVIPKETVNRVEINREDFISATNRVALMTTDRSRSVKLNITENEIEIFYESEIGASNEKIVVQNASAARIAFDPKFLTDPLNALTDDVVYFEYKDDVSPGLFKNKEGDFLCVVMPQRLT